MGIKSELDRNLGFKDALAIGIGTMIGAGIFVFPGIAAGKTGVSATISFAIGMVIAVLVALPTSELSTAMPKSGGGYYFVSRSMGTLMGSVVGIGLWVGLMFAAAFYLVGFGQYASTILATLGMNIRADRVLAFMMGVFLVGVGIVGTKKSGNLQVGIVSALVVILSLVLIYGLSDSFGLIGNVSYPGTFTPEGYLPIFTTSALIFTSYLGFVQISNMAGDIKEPEKNLPRSMIGSVIIVGSMYILTVYLATTIFSPSRLGEMGGTAMVEIGRHMWGLIGAVAIMVAGLLATISSANASILSSSRSVFALSKDLIFPEDVSKINRRYGTPHLAMMMTGIPILLLILLGEVEILAEVASFLHLIMYGLICFSLIIFRKNDPSWYEPKFKTPGYPIVPIIGGIFSFGLILFMNVLSLLIGACIIVVSVIWYYLEAKDVRLKGVS